MKEYLDVPFEIKADNIEESGLFRGYGSTFGGKPDSYSDVVVQGAFTKTLAAGGRNRTGIAMLAFHHSDQPIGVWNSLEEDKRGLKVEGQLAMNVTIARDTYELMKIGAIKGLSIGYDAIEWEYNKDKKIRYLKEISLWEISPVTFPANTRARILVVKALEEAKTEREMEKALREAGLSKTEALYVTKLCRSSLREAERNRQIESQFGWLSGILDSLREVNKGMIQR